MRVILEHVRSQTVPHDMLEELLASNVKFYDGRPDVDNICGTVAEFRHYRLFDCSDCRPQICV